MLVERLVAAAGIDAKRVSPHAMRHSYAMRVLRHGGDVVALSKLLGHASIATTQRYVDHLQVAELRAVLPSLPGLDAVA
jgi:integrase/recombinase XerD